MSNEAGGMLHVHRSGRDSPLGLSNIDINDVGVSAKRLDSLGISYSKFNTLSEI